MTAPTNHAALLALMKAVDLFLNLHGEVVKDFKDASTRDLILAHLDAWASLYDGERALSDELAPKENQTT